MPSDFINHHADSLETLRVYSINFIPGNDQWTCVLSGYGTTYRNISPTWQASGQDSTPQTAFAHALSSAPEVRKKADIVSRLRSANFDPNNPLKGLKGKDLLAILGLTNDRG